MKTNHFCKLLLMSVVIFLYSNAYGQNDPQKMSEVFLSGLISGKVEESLNKLFETSPVLNSNSLKTSLEKVIRHIKVEFPKYGKLLHFELIKEQKVSTRYKRQIYLLYTENDVIVFNFWYYKPHDIWFVNDTYFNSNNERIE